MADFIVAIELGSSKITGIAGRKNPDGSLSVTAVASEDSSTFINKGVVYNIDKTVQAITNIISKLEKTLKAKIARVYVGVGGRSIHSVINTHVKDLPAGTVVTQEMVDQMMDVNRGMDYPEMNILDVVTQEYKVDSQYQLDPVGIPCSRLEGNFLNILFRKTFYRNLTKCFESAGVAIAELFLAPLALADVVLTDNDKRSGCMLIDLGADTTTVAVYHKSVLRNLTVLPLGSANITKDIASLQIDELEAEKMKLRYASASMEDKDLNSDGSYPAGNDVNVPIPTFSKIVADRFYEIIYNALNVVPDGLYEKLTGGIVLTGGGSNMKNVDEAVKRIAKVKKVRIAHDVLLTVNSTNPLITAHDGRMNTLLGLLAKGDMNCAGPEFSNGLFDNPSVVNSMNGTAAGVNSIGGVQNGSSANSGISHAPGSGVVMDNSGKVGEETGRSTDGLEKKNAARKDDDKENGAEDEEREAKPTILSKFKHSMGRFFKTIISEEEDEK
ncbi:MAG: cell division protein FtsA [Prevotella sp.]|jgi:cell division protein FtsA